MTSRPDDELDAVDDACSLVMGVLAALTDEQARGQSLLPGWTRGHVITHLARSADGDRRCVEGAARDEVLAKYPDGMDGRARDIDAGATRSTRELVADLDVAQHGLVDAWKLLPDDAWERLADTPMGMRTITDVVRSRRRELLVHLVDLDVGVGAAELPDDYVAADAAWIAEFRPEWTRDRAVSRRPRT